MGQRALMSSWSLVSAGHMTQVPALLGAHEDTLSITADANIESQEPYLMQSKKLERLGMLSFALRMCWDSLWNEGVETQTAFLPCAAISTLQERAHEDLAARSERKTTTFLSDGDILTGWMTRVVSTSLPTPRPLTILHAMNVRFRVVAVKQSPGVFL